MIWTKANQSVVEEIVKRPCIVTHIEFFNSIEKRLEYADPLERIMLEGILRSRSYNMKACFYTIKEAQKLAAKVRAAYTKILDSSRPQKLFWSKKLSRRCRSIFARCESVDSHPLVDEFNYVVSLACFRYHMFKQILLESLSDLPTQGYCVWAYSHKQVRRGRHWEIRGRWWSYYFKVVVYHKIKHESNS